MFPQNAFPEIFKINITNVNFMHNAFWGTCACIIVTSVIIIIFCLSKWNKLQNSYKLENTTHLHLKRNFVWFNVRVILRPTLTTQSHVKLCYEAILLWKWAIPNRFWSRNEVWLNGGSGANGRLGLSGGQRPLWWGPWKPGAWRRTLNRTEEKNVDWFHFTIL